MSDAQSSWLRKFSQAKKRICLFVDVPGTPSTSPVTGLRLKRSYVRLQLIFQPNNFNGRSCCLAGGVFLAVHAGAASDFSQANFGT